MFDTLGLPFTPNLVVKEHSLNIGRLAWWLTIPGLEGGREWVDVLNSNNGILEGVDTINEGWRPTSRPGGYGDIKFNGSGSKVNISVPVGDHYSLAAWVRLDAVSNYPGILSAHPHCYLGFHYRNVRPRFYGYGADLYPSYDLNLGQWYRLIGTSTGTLMKLYINGVDVSTGYNYGSPAQTFTTIGSYGNGNYIDGGIDDVSIWSRALSAEEVMEDYNLSRSNYPGLIRRKQRIYDYSYLTDIVPPLQNSLGDLRKIVGLTAYGTVTPPIFSGYGHLYKSVNINTLSGLANLPIFRGTSNLSVAAKIDFLANIGVPIFTGSANLIKVVDLSATTGTERPVFSGKANLTVNKTLVLYGYYILEGFVHNGVLYVTDYIDLGKTNA